MNLAYLSLISFGLLMSNLRSGYRDYNLMVSYTEICRPGHIFDNYYTLRCILLLHL